MKDDGFVFPKRAPAVRFTYVLPLLLFVLLVAGCRRPSARVFEVADGLPDFSSAPRQQSLGEQTAFTVENSEGTFRLRRVAAYEISARVVGVKRYSRGWESRLSPLDLALAWGELGELGTNAFISYSQRNRWYFFKSKAGCPFDINHIVSHSANHHIIPATHNLRLALNTVRKNDLIEIKGYLVSITGSKEGRPYEWNTSTRRDDSGGGSCEIVYLEALQIGRRMYR